MSYLVSPFLVTVRQFTGGAKGPAKPDVNGFMPILLESQNGELPERARVLAGTIAKNAGLEVGNLYLVRVEETGTSELGPTFRHSVIAKVSVIEYMQVASNLPEGRVIVSTTPITSVTTEVVGTAKGKFN